MSGTDVLMGLVTAIGLASASIGVIAVLRERDGVLRTRGAVVVSFGIASVIAGNLDALGVPMG